MSWIFQISTDNHICRLICVVNLEIKNCFLFYAGVNCISQSLSDFYDNNDDYSVEKLRS